MLFQFEGRILLSYKDKDRVNFNYLSKNFKIFLIFFRPFYAKRAAMGLEVVFRRKKSVCPFYSSAVLFGNLHGIMKWKYDR